MFKGWKDREETGGAIQWDVWNPRMKRIYDLIAGDFLEGRARSVLDLGAGQMYLRRLLPDGVEYHPVDYISRCPETLVCDFDLHQFPQVEADIAIAAGILSYVSDVEWFLEQVFQQCCQKFVLTYTPLELEGDLEKREQVYLWRNHYTYVQLCQLLHRVGFLITHTEKKCYDGRVNTMILVLEKAAPEKLPKMASCTGCGVCAAGCPAVALEMAYDREGFLRPVFHREKCIRCGKCLGVCPAIRLEAKNSPDPESYAVWAQDEIRLQSSSGGAFSLLAMETLRRGGAVCGAGYKPNSRRIEHMVIREEKELPLLRGSKYVQSNAHTAYEALQQILDQETVPVLFCGCPCQVAALYSYLNKGYENLYTVDLLCGGVTAPESFRRYLEENWDAAKIRNVNCRTKEFGWNSTYITVESDNGASESVSIQKDPFEKLFHSFAGQRECCYTCAFSAFPRQGDLTLGDFWGVQNYDVGLDDGKGTSFVSINNEKGKVLFGWLKRTAQMVRQVPWQYTGTNRLFPFLAERVRLPASRDRFYHLLKTRSYKEAAELAVGEKYDVGVVCNWSGENYGAQLTQYAFYRTLTEMGLEAVLIERPRIPGPGGNGDTAGLFRNNPYPSYATWELIQNTDEMRRINDLADTFIVPSDQLWNALFAEKDLFALGYIANNKKKISYATSFGCDPHNWKEDERAREAFFLGQFDAVSVREDSGIRILEESFGVSGAVQTLDPVLLHDADFYAPLCGDSRYAGQMGGVAAFILDPDREKGRYIRWAREVLGLESIQICDVNTASKEIAAWDLPVEENIRVEDLLAVFRNSRFVITDSFHGVCLALVFHKRFVAMGNARRGLSRFQSILKQFCLEDRLLLEWKTGSTALLKEEIDYAKVEALLREKRRDSLNWLKDAIQRPKQAAMTAYDILDRELVRERQARRELEGRTAEADSCLDRRQSGVDAELLRINAHIDGVDAELLRINRRADTAAQDTGAVNEELLRVNGGIDAINGELLRVNQRADEVAARLEKEEQTSRAVNAELLRINGGIDAVNAELLRVNGGIDAINGELLRVNQRADEAVARLEKEEQTSGAVNAELLRINGNVDAVNAELLRINVSIDAVNTELLRMNANIDAINEELLRVIRQMDEAALRLSSVEQVLEEVRNGQQEQDQRFNELEVRLTALEGSIFYKLWRLLVWLPRKVRSLLS